MNDFFAELNRLDHQFEASGGRWNYERMYDVVPKPSGEQVFGKYSVSADSGSTIHFSKDADEITWFKELKHWEFQQQYLLDHGWSQAMFDNVYWRVWGNAERLAYDLLQEGYVFMEFRNFGFSSIY